MVGPLLPLLLAAATAATAQARCSQFRSEYCNLRLDKIMMLDTGLGSPQECQTACFERENCTEFTYFEGTNSRCVLFNECASPVSSCKSCISGPPYPRVAGCSPPAPAPARKVPKPRRFSIVSSTTKETTELPRAVHRSNGPSRPAPSSFEPSFRSGAASNQQFGNNIILEKDVDRLKEEVTGSDLDEEEYYEDDVIEEEEDGEDEVNIDDGLLDAVFDELPGTGQTRPPVVPAVASRPRAGFPQSRGGGGGFYYCIMGGSNSAGPVSTVSVMNVGTYAVPRTPLIAPFPSFMTQGSGRTFSVFGGRALNTCTPGYTARAQLLPASTFGPLFGRQSYVPGSCNEYDFSTRQWTTSGGKMTTAREGGSTLNVGSYIMSFGGFNTFGQPVTTVEIFDPRRPRVGWQNVPQWSFPRATRDHCSVVTRDPVTGRSAVLVLGGRGEEVSAMKLELATNSWFSVPPMRHGRTSHGCTPLTLNGRPGVVVSGGWDAARANTSSSVEFFDMNTHRWVDLPDLSRGRRGHTMTTIDGQLAVVGGVRSSVTTSTVTATGFRGEQGTEYLDDVEIFDGRRWKRAAYGLDQPRDGANLVKIPFSTFGSSAVLG